jgi:hypothetical protein
MTLQINLLVEVMDDQPPEFANQLNFFFRKDGAADSLEEKENAVLLIVH